MSEVHKNAERDGASSSHGAPAGGTPSRRGLDGAISVLRTVALVTLVVVVAFGVAWFLQVIFTALGFTVG